MYVFCTNFFVKKKGKSVIIAFYVLRFILSDAYFYLFYEKNNYCKIRNNIVKTIYPIENIF